jgi:hypothetical protein
LFRGHGAALPPPGESEGDLNPIEHTDPSSCERDGRFLRRGGRAGDDSSWLNVIERSFREITECASVEACSLGFRN